MTHLGLQTGSDGVGFVLSPPCPQVMQGFNVRVDSVETSKLGWVCGETFFNTYAPALSKTVNILISGMN